MDFGFRSLFFLVSFERFFVKTGHVPEQYFTSDAVVLSSWTVALVIQLANETDCLTKP